MTQKESSNVILYLRKKGWTAEEINEFQLYIATHDPSEEEVIESNREAKERKENRR